MFIAPSPASPAQTGLQKPQTKAAPRFGCRLFAYMSPHTSAKQDQFLKQSLLDGHNSLFWQSLTDIDDPEHCQFNGAKPQFVDFLRDLQNEDEDPLQPNLKNVSWGIAAPESRFSKKLSVIKEAKPAHLSNQFIPQGKEAIRHKPNTLLAHLRFSSQTDAQPADAHPFQHKDWFFLHNGVVIEKTLRTLGNGLERAERRLNIKVPTPKGQTDSELVQSYMIAQLMAETGQSNIGKLKTPQLKKLFSESIGTLIDSHRKQVDEDIIDEEEAQGYGLNFMISDGRRTLATRHKMQLYLGEWSTKGLDAKGKDKTYLVASRKIQPREESELPFIQWKEVPEQSMVVLKHRKNWRGKSTVTAEIEKIELPPQYPWEKTLNQRRLSFSNLRRSPQKPELAQ